MSASFFVYSYVWHNFGGGKIIALAGIYEQLRLRHVGQKYSRQPINQSVSNYEKINPAACSCPHGTSGNPEEAIGPLTELTHSSSPSLASKAEHNLAIANEIIENKRIAEEVWSRFEGKGK